MLIDGTGANGLALVYDEASEQDSLDDNLMRSWPYGVRAMGKQNWLQTLRVALRPHGSDPWTAKDCKEHTDELLGLLRGRGIQAALVLQSPATPGVRQVHSAWNILGHPGNPYKWAGTAERRGDLYVCALLSPHNYEYVYGWHIERWVKQAASLATKQLTPREFDVANIMPTAQTSACLEQILVAGTPTAIDIETNMAGTVITAIGASNGTHTVSVPWDEYVIANTEGEREPSLDSYEHGARIRQNMLALIENPNIAKILHNGAFDVLQLRNRSIALGAFVYDTLLLHRVAYAQHKHSLQAACATEFCIEPWKANFKPSKTSQGEDPWLGNPRELRTYNAKDTLATYWLCESLAPKVGVKFP